MSQITNEREKRKILFLCTHNSCRSQMAEGWMHHLDADRFEPYSAGIDPTRVDPYAVQVMAEAGVDISSGHAKSISEIQDIGFDYVVTVCDEAREQCPYFPARVRMIHAGFDDPPALAKEAGDEQAVLAIYRRVRDEIRSFVEELPRALEARDSRPP
jgi:arsenate reductase